MKKFVLLIVAIMLLTMTVSVSAKDMNTLSGKSLLLATSDGTILYEKNIDEKLPMASVTKITTALLVLEAIDNGKISFDDVVTVSETAALKTGSRVFLSVGEQITVRDLMKGIMVASGNDAAIALAEYLCGSETEFVNAMNKRAKELGMVNTNYENCHGLDSDNHYSSARDIMIVTKEIMKHESIFQFSTIWMDTLRNGSFDLANTNKLIRFYEGATGMKTGTTTNAKNCLCATAKRGNMHLIAIVMQAPTTQDRFSDASTLLNYGFNSFENFKVFETGPSDTYIEVSKGMQNNVRLAFKETFSVICNKNETDKIKYEIEGKPEEIKAPVEKGDVLSVAKIYKGDTQIGEVDMVAEESIEKISVWYVFCLLFDKLTQFIS